MDINSIKHSEINLSVQETVVKKGDEVSHEKSASLSISSTEAVVYEKGSETEVLTDNGYKVDMKKVNAMKADTEQRMIDLFRETVKKGFGKQVRGMKRFIAALKGLSKDDVQSASPKEDATGLTNPFLDEDGEPLELEITPEAIEKAQADVAEDGYWGANALSDRFLDFAKALSGDDPAKADMLLDAVKEGYKMAEELWGSELPQLSQDTLAMTIDKFEAWRDGVDYVHATEEIV